MDLNWSQSASARDQYYYQCLRADIIFANSAGPGGELEVRIHETAGGLMSGIARALAELAQHRDSPAGIPSSLDAHSIQPVMLIDGISLFENLVDPIQRRTVSWRLTGRLNSPLATWGLRRQVLSWLDRVLPGGTADIIDPAAQLGLDSHCFWITNFREVTEEGTDTGKISDPSSLFARAGSPLYFSYDRGQAEESVIRPNRAVAVFLKPEVIEQAGLYAPSLLDAGGYEWYMPYRSSGASQCRSGMTVWQHGVQATNGVSEWVVPRVNAQSAIDEMYILGPISPTAAACDPIASAQLLADRLAAFRRRGIAKS